MAKAKSKTAIIKEYLEKYPDAKGKQAEGALKKYDISAQYFYTIKSNLQKKESGADGRKPRKKAAGKKVRRRIRRAAEAPTFEELQSVASFAKEFGGLDKLIGAAEALRQFQMQGS